ncbi:MAG: cell division protein FtsW [Chloroflexi bacterium]|nr:cell division protein FtsW [Chloroflexota bacterium]
MISNILGVQRTRKKTYAKPPPFDRWLILIVSALLLVGLLSVFSVTYLASFNQNHDPTYFLMVHVTFGGAGVIAMLITAQLDYRYWKRVSLIIMGGILLMLVGVYFRPAINGAHRWLWGRSAQPSELAKLGIIIYIAHWASSKEEKIRQIEFGLLPFGLMVGLVTGLIIREPDLSTSVLIVLTSLAMFYVAGADTKQFILTTFVGMITMAAVVVITKYQIQRIDAWLHHSAATRDSFGYQPGLSEKALAQGGILGQGLGNGRSLWINFPSIGHDYIFSVIGNEAGLIGGLTVLGLFLILAYRGFTIALEAPDAYGTILATGITAWITIQALMHIAVATTSIPPTGVPLPFISNGGSSLIISLVAMGMLLNISRYRKPARG